MFLSERNSEKSRLKQRHSTFQLLTSRLLLSHSVRWLPPNQSVWGFPPGTAGRPRYASLFASRGQCKSLWWPPTATRSLLPLLRAFKELNWRLISIVSISPQNTNVWIKQIEIYDTPTVRSRYLNMISSVESLAKFTHTTRKLNLGVHFTWFIQAIYGVIVHTGQIPYLIHNAPWSVCSWIRDGPF